MSVKINVLGLGITDEAYFDAEAQNAFDQAEWIVGSSRQLQVVEQLIQSQRCKVLPKLNELKLWLNELNSTEDTKIAVLASGDPLFYGIGNWISRNFSHWDVKYYSSLSSVQMVCQHLGLAFQEVNVVSLHGRPIETIRSRLRNSRYFAILTDQKSTPQNIAKECVDAGFGNSMIWVFEDMGYKSQKISKFKVSELEFCEETFSPLNTVLLDAHASQRILPQFPGFPDSYFHTSDKNDTQMITKREVRLNILSLLSPEHNDVIWDVGAGCGSISVELAYWNSHCDIYAIEKIEERSELIKRNAERFGVSHKVNIINARAPEALQKLPHANKIFIGGSDGRLRDLLRFAWRVLPLHGFLVVSSILEENKAHIFQFMKQRVDAKDALYESTQIAVSKLNCLADQMIYRPLYPVNLYKFEKTVEVN